eukprot:4994252-Prymnesium_polylepis.1
MYSGCKCKGKHGQNQCTCGAVALGVAEVVPAGCDDKAVRALKGWLMSGGMPGVRKDRRGDALLQKQINILRQAASFERYFESTHHSCSGAPLAPVGTRFEWKRVKKTSAGPSRGRAELHEVVARGRAPDRSNRWACSLWRVCFKRGSKGRRGPLIESGQRACWCSTLTKTPSRKARNKHAPGKPG